MFELTNDQRKCFALPPVLESWRKVEVKPGPYDKERTYAYLDGKRIMKVIRICEDFGRALYYEYGVDQLLSEDETKLIPKTDKGKPQNFIAPNLVKRTPLGMALSFDCGCVSVSNQDSDQCFYRSVYDGVRVNCFSEFVAWVNTWCLSTGDSELQEINAFAAKGKRYQKFKEGDFFRYRINRSLYGYGRILLDFGKMRKQNVKFWDIFMGKPLCVSVYHIATEDANLTPEQLLGRKCLPSQMIMDNIFYYGECEVIGNVPITPDEEDFPIHYGRSISLQNPDCIHYQCGREFVSLDGAKQLFGGFRNGGIGWSLNVRLSILEECIKQGSNLPYWEMIPPYEANKDLRNPKFHAELKLIREQMGIE